MRAKRVLSALALAPCLLAAGSVEAAAQEQGKKKEDRVVVTRESIVVGGPQEGGVPQVIMRAPHPAGAGDNTFVFVSSEMTIDGKVVKGAPYSAEAVTETTQVLADGNRIVRKNTAQVYRDGEGRTRREQTVGMIGPFAPAGDPPQTVFIHDPVSGVNYILDPRTKTARKVQVRFSFEREPRREAEVKAQAEAQGGSGEGKPRDRMSRFTLHAPAPGVPGVGGPDVMFFAHDGQEPKVEELGTDIVEGVKAEGKRITVTIPAAALGNERDINIVTERWYSPELQTVVKTSHSDPRFGTTVYRLANINRTEPAASLFQLPADYTVKEGPAGFGGARTLRMKRPDPKENFFFEFHNKPEEN